MHEAVQQLQGYSVHIIGKGKGRGKRGFV